MPTLFVAHRFISLQADVSEEPARLAVRNWVPFLSGTPLPVLLFRSGSDCAPLLQRIADAGFIVVVSADLAAALAYVKREVMIADFTVDQSKVAAGAFGAAVGELVSFAMAHAAEIKAVAFVAPASNAEVSEAAVLGLPSLWVTAEDDVPGATIASLHTRQAAAPATQVVFKRATVDAAWAVSAAPVLAFMGRHALGRPDGETGAARVFRGLADAPMEATLIEAVHQGKLKVTTEASTQVLANSL